MDVLKQRERATTVYRLVGMDLWKTKKNPLLETVEHLNNTTNYSKLVDMTICTTG